MTRGEVAAERGRAGARRQFIWTRVQGPGSSTRAAGDVADVTGACSGLARRPHAEAALMDAQSGSCGTALFLIGRAISTSNPPQTGTKECVQLGAHAPTCILLARIGEAEMPPKTQSHQLNRDLARHCIYAPPSIVVTTCCTMPSKSGYKEQLVYLSTSAPGSSPVSVGISLPWMTVPCG